MKKIFFIIVILLAAGAAGFFAWKKYFRPASSTKTFLNGSAGTENNITPNADENSDTANSANSTPAEVSGHPDIQPSDCDSECARFQKDSDLAYCRQICNIPIENPDANQNDNQASGDCGSKNGLDKDYCLKDQAVSADNFDACDQIADSGVQKACKDRITEDILEQQNSAGGSTAP